VQLEVRPVYHKTDDRIRTHVFLCTLASLLAVASQVDGDAFVKIEGIAADALQMVSTNYISGPGDDNRSVSMPIVSAIQWG
jgi:hypothetical protein